MGEWGTFPDNICVRKGWKCFWWGSNQTGVHKLFQLVSSLYENNANSGFAPPLNKVEPPAEATTIEVEGVFDSLIYVGTSATHWGWRGRGFKDESGGGGKWGGGR